MKTITAVRIGSGLAAAAVIIIGGVASAQSDAFQSQIGVGAQGSEVTSLQTWLENAGYYNGPVTGYYGSLTMGGVESFQSANGISATGYVGPLTLAALNARASGSTTVGANTSEIASLQAQLSTLLAEIQALESNTTVTTTTGVPSGSSMSVQTNANTAFNGTLTASGTSPFTYALSTNPTNGVITSFNTATGAYTYVPNSNFSGNDSFSYTVRNSAGVSSPVTITLNVGSNASGVPTSQAFSFSTASNASYNGSLSASGNSPFTYTITSEPSHGVLSSFNSSTGAFTYTPTANYTGSDTFTYTVSNSAGASSPVTITANDNTSSTTIAPTGQNMSFATANGAALNGTLVASGTGPFTYAITTNPTWGSITNFSSSIGSFTYIPQSGYNGNDSFTYTVSNGTSTSVPYTVNITD